MDSTGKYYLIAHLTLFTGLSDRTIRNYLASGILQGEKINGMWHFTPEQVELFIQHPAVRHSIVSRNNGLVYDFLLNRRKAQPEACIILDIPAADRKTVSEFFCYRINTGGYPHIEFFFDAVRDMCRVTLTGNAAEVMRLINEHQQEFPDFSANDSEPQS